MRIAHSDDAETRIAVRNVLGRVGAEDAALTLLFYSPDHDPKIAADELRLFTGARGIGGSTAGEIGPRGFGHGGVIAMALHGSHVRAAHRLIPKLRDFSLIRASTLAADLAREVGETLDSLDPTRHVWMLLLDGLSGREDFFTPFFSTHAPSLPLVGGSFGDENTFDRVSIVNAGRVHNGAGVVVLLEYDRPFVVLHHTHLEFTDHWFEVTDTQHGGRLLTGLDGRPAVEVYAEALGVEVHELLPGVTGSSPFGFRFKGRPFPCSVTHVTDGVIHLAYSVQRGDRLNLLASTGFVEKSQTAIQAAMAELQQIGGEPQGMLAFHCLGRYLEAQRLGVVDELFKAMHQLPLVGLNTFGEQYGSRHMNHSLCGILFG